MKAHCCCFNTLPFSLFIILILYNCNLIVHIILYAPFSLFSIILGELFRVANVLTYFNGFVRMHVRQ